MRKYQMLANVDNKRRHFFKRFVNFILDIFAVRANSKLPLVRAAVSKVHSQTVTLLRNKPQ